VLVIVTLGVGVGEDVFVGVAGIVPVCDGVGVGEAVFVTVGVGVGVTDATAFIIILSADPPDPQLYVYVPAKNPALDNVVLLICIDPLIAEPDV
jgi:hypothetical protein